MYKLLSNKIIKRLSDGAFIPVDKLNRDYQQFESDVVGIGTTCVEGADYVGVPLILKLVLLSIHQS